MTYHNRHLMQKVERCTIILRWENMDQEYTGLTFSVRNFAFGFVQTMTIKKERNFLLEASILFFFRHQVRVLSDLLSMIARFCKRPSNLKITEVGIVYKWTNLNTVNSIIQTSKTSFFSMMMIILWWLFQWNPPNK